MEKQFVCVNCPMGCRLKVTVEGDKAIKVEGNICSKGADYAKQEAVNPMRVITSLMFAENREKPFSVKTAKPVPKKCLFECVNAIFNCHPVAPLYRSQVVIDNVCGTGVDVIATQDMA
jgi:CxxC motif-containing protein